MAREASEVSRIRLIIKPPGAYKSFLALALQEEWLLRKREKRREGHPVSYELLFVPLNESAILYYVEDDMAGVPYVQITGPDRKNKAEIVRQHIDVYSEHELFEAWDSAEDIDDCADAILRIGVAAPVQPKDRFFRRLLEGLEHPHAGVRAAALVAIGYTAWKEFKPLVEEIQEHDSEAGCRKRAQVLLQFWGRQAEE